MRNKCLSDILYKMTNKMTNKITLNDQAFTFKESFLPCLISWARKSWASYFSVSLIGNLIEQGAKVIFFTAFPMAKEELLHQIGNNKTFEVINQSDIQNIPQDKSIIIESWNKDLWGKTIEKLGNEDYILFVKNIEEYDKSILDILQANKKILLSGDMDTCAFKQELTKMNRNSKIIFTIPNIDLNITIPTLKKYESYIVNDIHKGILRLQKSE